MQAALQRYETACGGAPERLVSGSDDFTMFLWEPSVSKKPLQRLTGHMQLINQVRPCCFGLLPQKALNTVTETITSDSKNNKILSSSSIRYTPAAPGCCLGMLLL